MPCVEARLSIFGSVTVAVPVHTQYILVDAAQESVGLRTVDGVVRLRILLQARLLGLSSLTTSWCRLVFGQGLTLVLLWGRVSTRSLGRTLERRCHTVEREVCAKGRM